MAPEGKIKSKDLTYESNLPPFLQRLHAQKGGGGDPDRHERQIARPKKAPVDDAEDGPTVVDESGENLSKEEVERLTKSNNSGDGDGVPAIEDIVKGKTIEDGEPKASGALPDDEDIVNQKSEHKVTDGTATKKRKVGKVVGDDDNAEDPRDKDEHDSKTSKAAKMVKKKTKKPIRLAFDDGDEGT